MSSYRYSRFLLRPYLRLAMAICALSIVVILEEFEPGEEITWECPICIRRRDGVYTDDINKHPYCDSYENGKKHDRIKMATVARE